jgi:hypothetical protein
MRLTDLSPQFLKRMPEDGREIWRYVENMTEADGIEFLCPVCFEKNAGPIGTHAIVCWKPQVPAGVDPGPGRWPQTGSGYSDLTLTPSVLLPGAGCGAHFYVTNGEIRNC